MGAVVIADYRIGGKNGLTRTDLNKIIGLLGISDPQNKLPTGSAARYILLLETSAPTPTQVPVPPPTQVSGSKPKKRKKKKKTKL